ncbi:MAG TPA: hypothetical protein VMM92_14200, partial [Thermoanaerobaculia bacterium]|nr:hypothetical protein [Thermoanaerobaculia bacterium]
MADLRQQHDALSPGDKALDPSHPEAWGPALLLELLAFGPNALSKQGNIWKEWVRQRFNPDGYQGAGSWNWQHMIGVCLVWLDPTTPVTFLG